jgi:hypothetical protein
MFRQWHYKKGKRDKVMVSLFTNDSNCASSVNAAPSSQTTASNKKAFKKQ